MPGLMCLGCPMGGGLMKAVRWALLASAALAVGAAAGFVTSLLRPREYGEFAGVRVPAEDGAGLAPR